MIIIVAILIFSFIILFHELGHFMFAKLNGIRVNEFCLGLGPTIVGVTRGETKYSIKLLPFGGACMMEGEDEDSADDAAFNKKSVWARISVVAAGPVFNFILAFILAIVVIGIVGYDAPVVADTIPGYAAEQAGMQAGDKIVKLNSSNIKVYREIILFTFAHGGEKIDVTYERDGKTFETVLEPTYNEEEGRYLIGLTGGAREKGSVLQVITYSCYEVRYWIKYTFTCLKMIAARQVGINDLSGPVGIVQNIGDTYNASKEYGALSVFLSLTNFCIMISANLGVMNLLPIPALDGGRLVFLIIEAIRRKRIDPNKEGMIHFVGLMALMLLMVVVFFNDIRKIFM